jgi:hypothetical protein
MLTPLGNFLVSRAAFEDEEFNLVFMRMGSYRTVKPEGAGQQKKNVLNTNYC